MKTVVIPTVSCANVPQLACDLLVHTLQLKLVERLPNHELYPFAAAREDPGGQPGVCTSLEVMGDSELLVVAQRSPPLPGLEERFVSTLIAELKKHDIDRVILLTSADATYRNDAQLSQGPLIPLDLDHAVEQLSRSDVRDGEQDEDYYEEEGSGRLHGTGELRQLLSATRELGPVDCWCLFAHQGDNRADAAHMATHVLKLLDKPADKLIEPPSWQTLFGPPLGEDGGGMFW